MNTSQNEFLESASSRETSIEILAAMLTIAKDDVSEATRMWESATDTELLAIWANVTQHGKIDSESFCWGAAGHRWAYDNNIIEE